MNPLIFKRIVGCYSWNCDLSDYDTWLNSPEFTIKEIDNCNFQIQVFERHEPHSLQISVKKSNEKRRCAKITVSFLKKETTRIVDDWTNICLITNEPLELFMRSVSIYCNITWFDTTENSSPIPDPLHLFLGFKNFNLNSSLSDLKICIAGEELPAHKLILAAHSPVFLSMFETDMKEKKDNRIIIDGIELDVVKIVLSILYTGCDKDLDEVEMALKVLIVAERYDMKTLKRLCEWKLFQKLEVSNVLDILEAADNCNAEALRAACMDFIVDNKKQMMEAVDLITICHRKPEVVCELLKKLMSIPSLIPHKTIGN